MTSATRSRFVAWLRRVVSDGQDTAVPDAASPSAAAVDPSVDHLALAGPITAASASASAPAAVPGPPIWGTASEAPLPRRHELIAGITSVTLARRTRWARWIATAGVLGVALVVLVTARPIEPAMFALLIVFAPTYAIVSMTLPASWKVSRRRRQEHLAGYTLTRTSRRDLDQVDPATGYVIREAGQMALTPAQQRAAIAALSLPPVAS